MVIGRHDSPPTTIAACARFGNTRYQTDAALQGSVEVFASFKQACRDSSKSSPASSRLAWTRFTVNQLQTRLHGPDIQYISFKHACRAPIYRKSAQTCLQGLDIQYISSAQACRDSIYRKSASSRLAGPRYTVYQLQAGLHGFDIQYISLKQACRARYTLFQLSKNKQISH